MVRFAGRLRLVTTPEEIQREIIKASQRVLSKALARAIPKIIERIKGAVRNRILSNETADSIRSGSLRAEFGLIDGNTAMRDIANTLSESLNIQVKPIQATSRTIKGGFAISMIKADFSDILGLDSASFTTKNGEQVDWLSWLITRGDDIILRDYEIDLDISAEERARSRTGEAIMVSGKRGWRVPPEFSGVIDNNFITRSIEGIDKEIGKIVSSEILRRI